VKFPEPREDWPTAGYEAASCKRIHKIVNAKIGILLEEIILWHFFLKG
jgi:hypothetical protein